MMPPPPPPPAPLPTSATTATPGTGRGPALSRLDAAWTWGVLLVSAAVIGASMVLSPTPEAVSLFGIRLPELCTLRRLTGLSCPGCGLTRSFTYMGHGQPWAALQMHWGGPFLYLVVLAQIPLRIRTLWRSLQASQT